MAVGYYQHRDESLRAKIVSCRLVVIIANKINKKEITLMEKKFPNGILQFFSISHLLDRRLAMHIN